MTALLEALRRIETQRPSRSSSPAAPVAAAAPAPVNASPIATPAAAAFAAVEPQTIKMTRRGKPAVVTAPNEPPLNTRATVAADIEAAAVALVHRFRAPSLVALVTCGDPDADVEFVESLGAAVEAQGHSTTIFDANDGSSDEARLEAFGPAALQELRAGRGYHLVHTSTRSALEQTPLLALADGVVMLVELHRTPIVEAEAAVGQLRREAVAVSGILLIA